MIKKVYIYKVSDFHTFDGLCEYLNKNEIAPDKIVSISNVI